MKACLLRDAKGRLFICNIQTGKAVYRNNLNDVTKKLRRRVSNMREFAIFSKKFIIFAAKLLR